MIELLTKAGLSDNEAKVYLALLELGSATAQELSQKSGVRRPTTYAQIESLTNMGLVSSFEKAPDRKDGASKTYFRAEDPKNLFRIVENNRRILSERETALKSTLPQLENIFSSAGERPRVRIFDGLEGLKTVQDEFLKTKDALVESAASLDEVLKIFPAHPEDYTPRRVKRGIKSKLIYTTSRGAFLKDSDIEMLRESRYVPPEKFPFSCDVAIYGNTVALSVLRERPFAIVIENKEAANSVRALFYLAWEEAKKYN